MGIQIEDGTGTGFKVKVEADNALLVDAHTIPRSAFVSESDGQTYAWTSTDATAAAEESISVQNTSINKKNCTNCAKSAWWKFWGKKKGCCNTNS